MVKNRLKKKRLLKRYFGGIVGSILFLSVLFSSAILPHLSGMDPYGQDLRNVLQAPGETHRFGTDQFGRDFLARVCVGGRVSLLVAFLSVIIMTVGGVSLGLVAGFLGGTVEFVIMRFVDLLLAFPFILLTVLIVALTGPGMVNTAIAIGVASIPAFARLVRATTMEVMEQEYVMSARALGCTDMRVCLRHVLPNIVTPIAIQITYRMATSVLYAGSLSFIGLGVQPPMPEWGALLASGRRFMYQAPHIMVFPGVALAITTISIILIGDALRSVYEPRLRRPG